MDQPELGHREWGQARQGDSEDREGQDRLGHGVARAALAGGGTLLSRGAAGEWIESVGWMSGLVHWKFGVGL